MKSRLPGLLLLLMASAAFGAQRTAIPVGGPHRYVFLIDTSIEGARNQMVVRQTVYDLLITSMFGQMRPGDTVNIWTFDEELHTDRIPAIKWDPASAEQWGNRTDDVLKQEPTVKRGDFKKVMAAILNLAQTSASITIFLINDGAEAIKGTPFDRKLNAIFGQNAPRLRRTKKPFVVTILAQNGKMLAYRVSEGGSSIEIPAVPNRWVIEFTLPERATNQPNALTDRPAPPAETASSARPQLTLTPDAPNVEKGDSNALTLKATVSPSEAEPAKPALTLQNPPVNREAGTVEPPSTLAKTIDQDIPKDDATKEALTNNPVTAPASKPVLPLAETVPAPEPPGAERQPANVPAATLNTNPPPVLNPTASPRVEPRDSGVAVNSHGQTAPAPREAAPGGPITQRTEERRGEQASQTPPSAGLPEQKPVPPPRQMLAQGVTGRGIVLLAAICLLFAALGLVFWLGRRTAGAGRGSLITRSFDEENR